jgi:hypothetical protein
MQKGSFCFSSVKMMLFSLASAVCVTGRPNFYNKELTHFARGGANQFLEGSVLE